MNGEIRQANESLTRALAEIQKLWDSGENRLGHEEVLDKLSALREIVTLVGSIASIVSKFMVISK